MDITTILIALALLFGFYMAWSIGANDVANAMGTSVGSGSITIRQAILIAAIMEFSGAFFVGAHVSDTIRKGIVNPNVFNGQEMILVYGMIASLLASAVWLHVATYFGWPVSTTHTIVGAVLGFGLIVGGAQAIYWGEMTQIVASWVISPVLGVFFAYFVFKLLRNIIYSSPHPLAATKKLTPWLVFFMFFVLALMMVFKGLKNLHLDLALPSALAVSTGVGLLSALISHLLVRNIQLDSTPGKPVQQLPSPKVVERLEKAMRQLAKVKKNTTGDIHDHAAKVLEQLNQLHREAQKGVEIYRGTDEYKVVQQIFSWLQVVSACFVAFAHGANDVANAIGPVAAAMDILQHKRVVMESTVPTWLLALGGVGIVIGLATWGWRVIETIGNKITELTPTRGFSAQFAAALTVLVASKLGMPISTTHTLVGAVLGVGLARGIGSLDLRVCRDIAVSWVITVPAGAILTIPFFFILRAIFG